MENLTMQSRLIFAGRSRRLLHGTVVAAMWLGLAFLIVAAYLATGGR